MMLLPSVITRHLRALLLLASLLGVSGCLESDYSRYRSLSAAELKAHPVEGPYRRVKLAGPVTYLFREVETEKELTISLRGVRSTGIDDLDRQFFVDWERVLREDDVYVVTDTMVTNSDGDISAVLVCPRIESVAHDLVTGERIMEISSYKIMQQTSLSKGEVLLDQGDTNYWLYPALEYFEQEAKKKRRGYWGIPHDAPSPKESH